MQKESLDCEGIVDVGIVAMAHFENPAKKEALEFLRKIFLGEIKAVLPASVFLGAHHVLTRFLRLPKSEVSYALGETLRLNSEAVYESLYREDIGKAFQYCTEFDIEGWDAYYLALARRWGTSTVFSIDGTLGKRAKNFQVYNPIPEEKMGEYHAFLKSRLGKEAGEKK